MVSHLESNGLVKWQIYSDSLYKLCSPVAVAVDGVAEKAFVAPPVAKSHSVQFHH